MTPRRLFLAGALCLLTGAAHAAAPAPKCHVCQMRVDTRRHVAFRYEVAGRGPDLPIGSLTCAKAYWAKHRGETLRFLATDFASGRWVEADKGTFLVGSKLSGGTGMDKTSVIFFADREAAVRAQRASGGDLMTTAEAVARAANTHRH